MKTASKVFIILSIVFGIGGFLFGIFLITQPDLTLGYEIFKKQFELYAILIVICSSMAIVCGIIALKKIERAMSSKDLVAVGVCTILFCSFLGGLFMLLIKDDELTGSLPY